MSERKNGSSVGVRNGKGEQKNFLGFMLWMEKIGNIHYANDSKMDSARMMFEIEPEM